MMDLRWREVSSEQPKHGQRWVPEYTPIFYLQRRDQKENQQILNVIVFFCVEWIWIVAHETTVKGADFPLGNLQD